MERVFNTSLGMLMWGMGFFCYIRLCEMCAEVVGMEEMEGERGEGWISAVFATTFSIGTFYFLLDGHLGLLARRASDAHKSVYACV